MLRFLTKARNDKKIKARNDGKIKFSNDGKNKICNDKKIKFSDDGKINAGRWRDFFIVFIKENELKNNNGNRFLEIFFRYFPVFSYIFHLFDRII